MFLNYYCLREQPFGVTPDPRYLYQSAGHREALASLVCGIESELGFTSLIAEPGMGKTTLLYYLLSRYDGSARTAFIFETQCTARELLQQVFSELEIAANGPDPVAARNRFREFLVAQARARQCVLVILDEAQNLDNEALETVRLLSDCESSQAKLLHILLAGQPQLAQKLAHPELKQLRQRITMSTHLAPFALQDTRAYIEYRLSVAGYSGPPLFTPDAYELIATETHGIPREINRMCFNALSLGCALGKKTVDVQVVREVSLDLQMESVPCSELQGTAPSSQFATNSVIVKGELSGSEDLYLDGEVEGTIELRRHSLTIGPNGRVRADVHARDVVVHGKVDGNVFGAERVELKKSAILVGDVVTQHIVVEDGACFKGGIDIQKKTAKPEPKPEPKCEAAR